MASPGGANISTRLLVIRVRDRLCGVPVQEVLETCRPLPTEPFAGAPPFVLGLALIRARPTPVLDARRLLGVASEEAPTRYVTLKVDDTRVVALAVDAVVGVRDVPSAQLEALPNLLSSEQPLARALGTLDQELLLLLEHSRLLPDALWAELERERASA